MFKLINPLSNTKVEVSHNGQKLEFQIETLINRRLRIDLDPKNIFVILNKYLDYKGDEFKEELFRRLVDVNDVILSTIVQPTLEPLPLEITHNILDMFDLQDVYNFIIESKIIKAPDILADEFDEKIIINDEGSREQTYLKKDYLELVALLTILKATLGPIGQYAAIKDSLIPQEYKEFILLNFYSTHPIYHTPPFVKLLEYIKKLVDISLLNEEESSIRVIEKIISKSDLPEYVLGNVLFQRFLLHSELNDVSGNKDKNLVNILYNFVKSKIKLKDISNSSIRLKKQVFIDSDNESESVLESYRVPTDITIGYNEEFKFVFNNIEHLMYGKGIQNTNLVYRIREMLDRNETGEIPLINIKLAAVILKNVIDVRAVDYVDINGVKNAIAVAAVWLIEHNFPYLAKILTSYKIKEDIHRLNISVRSKLDKEIREELDNLFLQRGLKSSGKISYQNYLKEFLDQLAVEYSRMNLVTALDKDLLEELRLNADRIVELDPEIKNIIGRFFIELERSLHKDLDNKSEI